MRGRAFSEAPDITARICGICPVAYQMSSVHAMEDALGVTVDGPLRELRRLLYCGEWIESHTLHVYMLHAPDFLGYAGAIDMARDHGDVVRKGLALKKAGNDIVNLVGGREIHPINVKVGGFYRTPTRRELEPLAETLKTARDLALETVKLVAGFDFPDRERDYVDRRPPSSGRIPLQRGPDRLEWRPRYPGRRLRQAFRGNACRAVDRAAVAASRRRLLSGRAARPLQSQLRPAVAAGAGGGARGRARAGLQQSLPQHHRPLGRDSLRLRRGAAHHRRLPAARPAGGRGRRRAPASATARPRRRAGCSITATGWRKTAPSPRRRSCRRPRRTSRASRRTSAAMSAAGSISTTRPCSIAASRRSATTTPASPARPISSSSSASRSSGS